MAEVTLEQAPRKAREMFEKGFAAMERDNLDYAMDMFLAALDLEPRLLRARKFLRAAQLKKTRAKKAGLFGNLLSGTQGLPAVLGIQSALKKEPARALRQAEDLLRIDPLNLSFLNLYCEAAVAAELPEAGVLSLEAAREHLPTNDTLIERLAHLYQDLNETQKARECFETLVRLRPNDQAALKMLKDSAALDTMKTGGWTGATSYRDVIKDRKEAALLEQQSKAVTTARGSDALIEETLAKIQREPNNQNYRRALAELYVKNEQFTKALQVLEEAQQATGAADPELARAVSATRLREFEARIAALAAAGQTAEAGEQEQAKQTFLMQDAEERVRRYPNDLQFKYDLGVLYFERSRIMEAIEQLQKAKNNPQRRVLSMYYLALCFKAKQQFDLARDQLEKAASELRIMDETKKDIVYEQGLVAEAMGLPDEASVFYKEIYSVDIGYKDVARKIEQSYRK